LYALTVVPRGFLSRYAVAEETERGELDVFRLRGEACGAGSA
jgi:hypothetical protein